MLVKKRRINNIENVYFTPVVAHNRHDFSAKSVRMVVCNNRFVLVLTQIAEYLDSSWHVGNALEWLGTRLNKWKWITSAESMEYQIPFFVNEILSQLQAINMHLLDINKQNILNAEFTAEEVHHALFQKTTF